MTKTQNSKRGHRTAPAFWSLVIWICFGFRISDFGFSSVATATSGALPNSSRECAICHIRWVDALDRKEARDLTMQEATERQAGSGDMCLSCHDGSVVDSRFKVWSTRHHATDAVPSPKVHIPTDKFPLDAQGRMTCATCHTAHAVPGNSDLRTVIFLRQPNVDSSLCLACHSDHAQKNDFQHPLGPAKFPIPKVILEAGGRTAPDGHTVLCQTCHEPHGARNPWMLVLPPSELCIACHTEKAPEVSPPAGAPVHRIGHTYTGFQPPATLLKERASFGPHGELTCLSCHRLHDASGAKPLLIRKNQDSSLCLECHQKEKAVLGSPHDLRVSSPETENARGEKPAVSGPCGACHRVHGWAREVPETNRPHSSGCMECHGPEGPGSRHRPYIEAHPVGVALPPGKTVALPLDQATREIGCLTCHDPHAGRKTEGVVGSRTSVVGKAKETTAEGTPTPDFQFLRQEGSQLCVLCHDQVAPALQGPHDPAHFAPALRATLGLTPAVGSCRLCHTAHNAQGPHLWARPPANSTDSPTSNLCAACHDQEAVQKPQGTHHPLGVPSGKLEVSSALPASYSPLLISPEVSCLSCHDVHNGAPSTSQLWGPPDSLCLTCHQDKERIRGSVHDPGTGTWATSLGLVSQGLCLDCHRLHGPKKEGRLWKALGGPQAPETLCEACHRPGEPGTTVETPHLGKTFDLGSTQPVGPHPRAVVRCTSCHDIHQNEPPWGPQPQNSASGSPAKLLGAPRQDATLCLQCHAGFAGVLDTPHDLRKSAPFVRNVRGEPVNESGPCGVCHLVHPAFPGAPAWAQRVPPGDNPGTGLCTCCHSQDRCAQTRVPSYTGHPEVALVNRFSPGHPEYMPTFDEHGRPSTTGIITCPTCHQMHAPKQLEVGSRKSEDLKLETSDCKLLRTNHQTLCADCHGQEAPWRFLYFHGADRNPHRVPSASAPPVEGPHETDAPRAF